MARKNPPRRRPMAGARERHEAKLYKCMEVKEKFCEYVEEGLPPDKCCYLVGMEPSHYYLMEGAVSEYIANGTVPDNITVESLETWAVFFEYVYAAVSKHQLNHIRHALSVDSTREDRYMWARSMAILERRDPDNWRLKKEMEITKRDFDKDESFL